MIRVIQFVVVVSKANLNEDILTLAVIVFELKKPWNYEVRTPKRKAFPFD